MLCLEKHVYFTWYTLYIYVIYRKSHFLNEIIFFTNFHWFKKIVTVLWIFLLYTIFLRNCIYKIIHSKYWWVLTYLYFLKLLAFCRFFLSKSICQDGIMKFAYSCNFRLPHNYVLQTVRNTRTVLSY